MILAFLGAVAASYQDLFPQPQDIHSIQDVLTHIGEYYSYNILERIIICGALPSTVASLWLATLIEYYEKRKLAPLVMVGGLLVGGAVGFVIHLLTPMGPFVLIGAMIAVTVVALIPLFKFFKNNGWLLNSRGAIIAGDWDDDDDYNYKPSRGKSGGSSIRSYGSSSGYSYGGSSSSGYSEGDSQLDYYMDDVASSNSRSRNLPYDCSIRSDVSFSHYGDDAYFTVDLTLDTSGCSAETQQEYNMMVSDAQSFQREVMNDLFREGKNVIARMKKKYPDFGGVNFEVKVGNINEY